MKNVLVLTSVGSMVDQFLLPSIQLLKDLNYKVHVACNFEKGNTSSDKKISELKEKLVEMDVEYFQIDFARNVLDVGGNIKAYKQVHLLMKRKNFEFIHCHSPIGGVCGRLVGKVTATKVIYTAHGFHFFKGAPMKNWLLYYPIEKWCARYTDCLITINKEDYQTAINRKFKARSIRLVNGVGIDLGKFKDQSLEKKACLRSEYGYNQDDFLLIFVGELSYRKHQDMLIKVISELNDQMSNLKLLLVGSGDCLDQYQNQVMELGIENRVDFLGFRSDIPKLMEMSDVVVSSARQEGLPVNIMEGMATGLPAVVTNCRGNRDLVSDGENGFVIEIDDTTAFAHAIYKLNSSKQMKISMGKKSTEMILNYSLEKVQSQIEEIYKGFSE